MTDWENYYQNKNVLITGGLGFLGSNLAILLSKLGAKVSIMDSRLENHGANDTNIQGIKKSLRIYQEDIRDAEAVKRNIKGQEIIFNLAGQVNHADSEKNPFQDIEINCEGHMNILQALMDYNPSCRIVYPTSRMTYGKIKKEDLPIKEAHPLSPQGIYAINKATAERYYEHYKAKGIDALILRITNPYGPRAQVKTPNYGIINWFIRKAIEDGEITIFGKGDQLRDIIFVDDISRGFAMAGAYNKNEAHTFNLGAGTGLKLRTIAETVINVVGGGRIKGIPWPVEYKLKETGDFVADISLAKRHLGWEPITPLEEGIQKTAKFYRQHKESYFK